MARLSIRLRSVFGVAACGLEMGFLNERGRWRRRRRGKLLTWLSRGALVGFGVGG